MTFPAEHKSLAKRLPSGTQFKDTRRDLRHAALQGRSFRRDLQEKFMSGGVLRHKGSLDAQGMDRTAPRAQVLMVSDELRWCVLTVPLWGRLVTNWPLRRIEMHGVDRVSTCELNGPLITQKAVHLELRKLKNRRFSDPCRTSNANDVQTMFCDGRWSESELVRDVVPADAVVAVAVGPRRSNPQPKKDNDRECRSSHVGLAWPGGDGYSLATA
jgi:hypothetical protein